jgi:hypothetical protein
MAKNGQKNDKKASFFPQCMVRLFSGIPLLASLFLLHLPSAKKRKK